MNSNSNPVSVRLSYLEYNTTSQFATTNLVAKFLYLL